MSTTTKIYVALPVLNESVNIPDLIKCMHNQSFKDFKLIVCVNQYENWWQNEDKVPECEDNQKSLQLLNYEHGIDIDVIDRSSHEKGWPVKKGGVGWARKTIMDFIVSKAHKNDIIVSVDADTYYPADYLQFIVDFFAINSSSVGLASSILSQVSW